VRPLLVDAASYACVGPHCGPTPPMLDTGAIVVLLCFNFYCFFRSDFLSAYLFGFFSERF
jgi:hypothetical protein